METICMNMENSKMNEHTKLTKKVYNNLIKSL